MNIVAAMRDPHLFGRTFSGASWAPWRALLGGVYGLALDDDDTETFKSLTGRTSCPTSAANELWLVVGRRGGKSLIAALVAVFEAFFSDYDDQLAAGEVATVLVVSPTQKQSRVVMRYIRGLVESSPMLAAMVVRDADQSIELENRVVIEVCAASYRTVRGYTLAAVIADEIAFWHVDGVSPDEEILAAVRPALATLNGKLIALSSPYARRGVLWESYRRHYGKEGNILVAQADTSTMNPLLPASVIADAYAADPIAATAEYGAMFRTDVETFVTREALDGVVIPDRIELPYMPGTSYRAFTDPSGGCADAFTMAIAHRERDGTVVVDAIRATRPPFSPESVVEEFSALLGAYRIREVVGDAYAGEWPREQFGKRGVTYKRSEKDKSALYRDLLPVINSGRVELPDNKTLYAELANLERRTSRGGRDRIDHAPGQHDDIANAVAGVVGIVGGGGFDYIKYMRNPIGCCR